MPGVKGFPKATASPCPGAVPKPPLKQGGNTEDGKQGLRCGADAGAPRRRSPPSFSPTCSSQQIALRPPSPRGSPGPPSRHPASSPGSPGPPSRRPARPRTLLFTSMVPRQPLLAPCRWPRFMLSARPPAASSGAGPRERGQRGRGARARGSERRSAPRHRTCRAPRSAAPAAPRRPEGRLGSAAGGDSGPSQRGSGAAAAAAAVRRGRSTVPQPPQPGFSAGSPAGGRARAARCSCTPAGLQPRHVHALTCKPREQPRRLALRPHPTGSAHLRPRRQPIGTLPARLARRVGGSRAPKTPPTASRLVSRWEGGAGSPETVGPLRIERRSSRTHAPAAEFPPREGDGEGRPEALAHLNQRLRRVCFVRMRVSLLACWAGSGAAESLVRPSHGFGMWGAGRPLGSMLRGGWVPAGPSSS